MKYTPNKKSSYIKTLSHLTMWDGTVEVSKDLMTGLKLLILAYGNLSTEKKIKTVNNFSFLPNNIKILMVTDNTSWKILCDQLGIEMCKIDTTIISSMVSDDLEYYILYNGVIICNEKVKSESWISF